MAHHASAKFLATHPRWRRVAKFKALITDVQGTLIPSGAAERALRALFPSASSEDIISTGIGRPKRGHIAALWKRSHGYAPSESLLDAMTSDYQKHLLFTPPDMDFVPGARETLCKLAEYSIPHGFVTGFARLSMQPMLNHWAKQGIVFDAFGTSDGGFCGIRQPWQLLPKAHALFPQGDVEHSKTTQIAALLKHWDVAPADVIFLGDTPYDMAQAREAACGHVIGVTDHSALKSVDLDVSRALCAAGADFTIPNWWPIHDALQ